ncbi:MAG TPA: NAD-dependent epimerase/dehydratase family protein [Ignavibacteria bacterium]|nr:NAD-dependent epimerase/dehydratase family protein [Ignavibacteria bacterium]
MKENKNCIIYGGGGFIGSHLAEELLNSGYNVTIFDKLNFSKLNILHLAKKVNIIEGDFNNEVDIKNSLKGINFVFHLVSSTLPGNSNDNPIYDIESNLVSSLRLFDDCIKLNIEKVIFVSSGGTVYGIPEYTPIKESHPRRPLVSYAIIKNTIEDYLYLFYKNYGLNYTSFRLSNPYGERQNPFSNQGVIAVMINKHLKDEKIEIWGDGSVIRDFIYIKDAVKPLVNALSIKTKNNIFNLGSGKGYSLNQVINVIENVSEKKMNVEYKEARKIDVPENVLDIENIKSEFNWMPEHDLPNGISKSIEYYRKLTIPI